MSIFNSESLTLESFETSGWQNLIAQEKNEGCSGYSRAFRVRAVEAHGAGDEQNGKLFDILAAVTSMYLRADDKNEPYGAMFQSSTFRTTTIHDFNSNDVAFLNCILPVIDDNELKARLADVIWLVARTHTAAQQAVDAYLAAAKYFQSDERWPLADDRIKRALDLSFRLNNEDFVNKTVKHIDEVLSSIDGFKMSFFPARLMTLMLDRRIGDASRYSKTSEELAYYAEAEGNWHRAQEYWNLAARWHMIAGDEDSRRSARLLHAEAFVKQAEAEAAKDSPYVYMSASHALERGIQAYRNIGGMSLKIDELHQKLREYQKLAMPAMSTFSHSEDATDMVSAAIACVTGKSIWYDAVFALVRMCSCPRKEKLRAQAEQIAKESVIASLFPTVMIGRDGRVLARGSSGDDEESKQRRLQEEMFKYASLSHSVFAQAGIEPSRQQIVREYRIGVFELQGLVVANPFVPEGREGFFARGLLAGLQGDYVMAAHLLIPQIENTLRAILNNLGVASSSLDSQGIQKLLDLNAIFQQPKYREILENALGEDLVFDLRGLLVEEFGSNLRNQMAHGLMSYDEFQSYPCCYLWWLTMRLVCVPVINRMAEAKAQANQASDDDSQDKQADASS